jgi:hypothetical protein
VQVKWLAEDKGSVGIGYTRRLSCSEYGREDLVPRANRGRGKGEIGQVPIS